MPLRRCVACSPRSPCRSRCARSASTSTSAWRAGSSSSRSPRPASTSCSATAAWCSFGHAAFVGLGAYVTGVPGQRRRAERPGCTWPRRSRSRRVAALVIGAISLRTRGVYFIMITLAFAQMLYYLANSVKGYGGDEGLRHPRASLLPLRRRPDAIANDLLLRRARACCVLALVGAGPLRALALRPRGARAARRRRARRGARLADLSAGSSPSSSSPARSAASPARSRANLQGYVSPNELHWTQSGTLMVMVILGGVGSLWGGVVGAAVLLLLEEVLSAWTEYWASGPAGCCSPPCCSRATASRACSGAQGAARDRRPARGARAAQALRRRWS